MIRIAGPADFPRVARLIQVTSLRPETHCIQSDVHSELGELVRDLETLQSENGGLFVVAERGQAILGSLGCELDRDAGRAWLRGPHVVEEEPWPGVAEALLGSLITYLPPEIRRLDAFPNLENRRGVAFYREQGFREVGPVHVYEAVGPPQAAGASGCREMSAGDRVAVARLHDAAFTDVWLSGSRLAGYFEENHKVFVHDSPAGVNGYVYASLDREEGVIEFLAVDPAHRGRGVGLRLLNRALDWIFREGKARVANLTVRDELTDARALYRKAGFRLEVSGLHLRRDASTESSGVP